MYGNFENFFEKNLAIQKVVCEPTGMPNIKIDKNQFANFLLHLFRDRYCDPEWFAGLPDGIFSIIKFQFG
jgi:hypothetical protein